MTSRIRSAPICNRRWSTPRYYQLVAVNRATETIAKGRKRVLLMMVTGTGKTFTAFQIICRLLKSRTVKRVLFFADRNVRIDQTKTNDFRPSGKQMTKITGHNEVWRSENGSTWAQVTSSPDWTARTGHSCFLYDDKMWVLGGKSMSGGDSLLDDVWYSEDGIIWEEKSSDVTWDARYLHSSAVLNGKMWVIGGRGLNDSLSSYTYLNDTWWSW